MKTLEIHELSDYINEILQMLEEGETIELTNGGKVVGHLIPVQKPQQSVKKDLKTFWADVDRLTAEIGKHVPDKVDVDDIMRDMRRDF